jgi:uncharacterized membrane protein YkvA (DUF1232 family)
MINPLRPALDRIALGCTTQQKIVFTIAGVIYVISPFDFDFIPVLGWVDDGMVIYLVKQLWAGPTLPPKGGAGNALGSALKSKVATTFTHAWKDFAKGFADAHGGRS